MANETLRNRYVNDGAGAVPQPRLLIMLYDRLVLDLQQGISALGGSDYSLVHDKLFHAQQIILELHSALDVNAWDGADQLSQLYTWFYAQLIDANINKNPKPVESVLKMVMDLRASWQSAYEQVLTAQSIAAAAPAPSTASVAAVTSA